MLERATIGGGTTGSRFAWIDGPPKTADERYHRRNALGGAARRELAGEFGEEAVGLNPGGMLKMARRSHETAYAETREQAQRPAAFDHPGARQGPNDAPGRRVEQARDLGVGRRTRAMEPCSPGHGGIGAVEHRQMQVNVEVECGAEATG